MKKRSGLIRTIKIMAFAVTVFIFSLVGLLSWLRPETSDLEKRTLTEAPGISLDSIASGSYFRDTTSWYSDTYPMREMLLRNSIRLHKLYGFGGEEIVGSEGYPVADEIPDINSTDPIEPPAMVNAPTLGESSIISEMEAKVDAAKDERRKQEKKTEEERATSFYVKDGAGYELYYFNRAGADDFAAAINSMFTKVRGRVNIYLMLVPTSGVLLDDNTVEKMGASNQKKAIEYLYSRINPSVHTIDLTERIKEHKSEYIYFKTDPHWTQLGAYYAYLSYCEARGYNPRSLSEYTDTINFKDFSGAYCKLSSALSTVTDTVEAYVPLGTNDMKMVMKDGGTYEWSIIRDVKGSDPTELYSTFSGGNQAYSSANNKKVTDGSTALVIKDSFGNPFVPWLVDQYENLYWVDTRLTSNTISQMVRDTGIQDVIIVLSLFDATNEQRVEDLIRIGQ